MRGGILGFRPFLRNDPLNASLLPPLLNKCLYFPMPQEILSYFNRSDYNKGCPKSQIFGLERPRPLCKEDNAGGLPHEVFTTGFDIEPRKFDF